MAFFRRRKHAGDDEAPDEAIEELARHGGVSIQEAKNIARGMSADDIREFIELDESAARAEADPAQPATKDRIARVFDLSEEQVENLALVMSETELQQVIAKGKLPEGH